MPLKKDSVLFTVIFIWITIETFYRPYLYGQRMQPELEEVNWPQCACMFRREWETTGCIAALAIGTVLGSSMYLQPPPPPPLPLTLHFSDSLLSSLSPVMEHNEIRGRLCRAPQTQLTGKNQTALWTSSYPFKLPHVSGLYWSPYKCQVVDLCRLLFSLVWLDKQLRKKTNKQTGMEEKRNKPVSYSTLWVLN